ncbi:glycosyltransferase family 39 protein [Minwuia sp.]|uniref:glycosyltransferase family 39 protein n=1 Tax=Minwuia sp. TaxID=2493630 RepID=UPI003A9381A4
MVTTDGKSDRPGSPHVPGRHLDPSSIVATFIVAQLVFWTALPAISHSAPPLDVVESLVWGREWLLGTHKHPPLPSWLLEAGRLLTGSVIWMPFLLSQICVGLTLLFVFLLGRRMFDARAAAMGTLLLGGLFYFSWPTPEFNHNVVQMPIWAGVALFLHRAERQGDWLSWIMLALLGALAIYSKFSAALMLLFVPLWLLLNADGRAHLKTAGPWVALVVFIVLVAPEALWLIRNDFLPLEWASLRAGGGGTPATFLLAQVADHLPMLIVAGAAGLIGRGMLRPMGTGKDRKFLLLMGFGPLILTVVVAVFMGGGLKDMWGAPMFSLSGLIVVAFFGGRLKDAGLKRGLASVLVLIVLVSSVYAVLVAQGPHWFGLKPMRGAWPGATIQQAAEAHFEAETGQPMKYVIGDFWLGGLATITARHDPSLLMNGDPRLSPWIDLDDMKKSGALIIWQIREGKPAPGHDIFGPVTADRQLVLPWKDRERPPLLIGMQVLPPQGE